MVLESTIICVDNSDFMRNGDFIPTRMQAQHDAVNVVCNSKTRSNPENNVGLLTMAGRRVEVLTTLTSDAGRIMAKLHLVQPQGEINFSAGIRIAHLALKHRQGKNHKTRIVAFVGSPIQENEKDLEKLAKKLKKEKVFVDVVNFGEDTTNMEKLNVFITTLNGKDGQQSHLVTVPPGPILSDALVSSPIIQGEEGAGAIGGATHDFDFGVDAEADPELALALRVSMEEQRHRQEEEARRAATTAKAREPTVAEVNEDDDEAQLAAALAMSTNSSRPVPSVPDFSSMTEEEQIAFAMQMSLQPDEPQPPPAPKKSKKVLPGTEEEEKEEEEGSKNRNEIAKSEDRKRPRESEGGNEGGSNPTTPGRKGNEEKKPRVAPDDEDDYSEVMNDPAFLQSVLQNLPGVDPNSDAIKNAVSSITGNEKDGAKKTKKEEDKK